MGEGRRKLEQIGNMSELGANLLEGIPIVGLTAPGLLGIAILMILTGKLWTNAAYQQKCQEAERWRLAYEAEREARGESEAGTKELLELAKTTQALITGVFTNSEHIRRSGEADAPISKT